MIPIILSGGVGARPWLSSQKMYPKKNPPLADNETMLREITSRLDVLGHQTAIDVCAVKTIKMLRLRRANLVD